MKKSLLLFTLVLTICSTAMNAAIEPSEPQKDEKGTYKLSTAAELYWFAKHVNDGSETACAILSADITVNTGVLDSNGNLNSGTFETWTPIGSWGSDPNTYKGFAGEFNGNGHTISGLYFNDEQRHLSGFSVWPTKMATSMMSALRIVISVARAMWQASVET